MDLQCSKCQQYQYDYEPVDAKLQITGAKPVFVRFNGQPTDKIVERPPASKPPCFRCPKENPEKGKIIEDNLPWASKLLDIYHESQAANGRNLAELDPLLIKLLGIVNDFVDKKRQYTIAESVLPLLFKT